MERDRLTVITVTHIVYVNISNGRNSSETDSIRAIFLFSSVGLCAFLAKCLCLYYCVSLYLSLSLSTLIHSLPFACRAIIKRTAETKINVLHSYIGE